MGLVDQSDRSWHGRESELLDQLNLALNFGFSSHHRTCLKGRLLPDAL